MGRGGGWWDHLPALATLGKMALERVWDFSALGGPTSSVSGRVVKLTVSHYTIRHHCHSKREAMGTKFETLSCSFQALGVGRAWVGMACTMAPWRS